jgi:hypothetical protein
MQTLTENRQTQPLVREGAPQRHNSNKHLVMRTRRGLDIKTARLAVHCKVASTLKHSNALAMPSKKWKLQT